MRKGQCYGTLLVDLEQHRPIDLLPDRESQPVAAWLAAHPGIEIITRDRGKMYIEGATQGAPEAIQVADRFYLLVNLQETLKRMFEHHPGDFHAVKKQLAALPVASNPEAPRPTASIAVPNDEAEPKERMLTAQGSYRTDRFQIVKDLQRQGLSQRAIARQVGMDHRTVGKYFVLAQPPIKSLPPQNRSTVRPFFSYLQKRWQEGCQNRVQLLEELRTQGYRGSYASLRRAIVNFPTATTTPAHQDRTDYRWSPSQAAWLLVAEEEKLTQRQKVAREALLLGSRRAAIAAPLAQSFRQMVRERQAEKLDHWLVQAETGEITEFRRFAVSLRSDYQAVKAGLALEWSNDHIAYCTS